VRVLQANRFFSPRGGSETVMFQTIQLLEQNGHTVVPFSMEDAANKPSRYSSFFVRNVVLEPKTGPSLAALAPNRWPLAGRGLYSREAEHCLEALVRAARPDVAHLHSIYHQLSPSVLPPLRRHSIPTVLTLHDYKLVCPSSIMFADGAVCERCKGHKYYNAVLRGCVHDSRWKAAFCATESTLHDAMGIYRRNIDMYIAPSKFLKQKMTEFGMDGERIVHVPNPINLDDYSPDSSPGNYILFAGRLEEVKGVHLLLEAIAGSEVASRFELKIAGDGRRRADLEEWCRKHGLTNVTFLGWQDQDSLAELHRGALFAVVPSIWYEVFSLAVLEAQAYGKAVVGANIGGIPELIDEGRTGLLFEAGNVGELRSRIEQLIANPEQAANMGSAARESVERNCTADQQYRRLMAVYEEAIERRQARTTTETVAAGGAR
jgi:glycosyltransferase involved in cell wall biosynthesis